MNLLENIVEHKRQEISARKRDVKVSALSEKAFYARKALPMATAIRRDGAVSIIAEFKRSSPSAGVMTDALDAAGVAREYAINGAAAVSILTDGRYFSGSLDDLSSAREAVGIPLLRKDFILDEYQIHEARASGADAVLLIAAILDRISLADLHAAAVGLGLDALVELYDEREIDNLDTDSMRLIGVNNRDLRTMELDLRRTEAIAGRFAGIDGLTIVSESGIRSPADLRRLAGLGVSAALIGEHFMRSGSPGKALRALLNGAGNAAAR